MLNQAPKQGLTMDDAANAEIVKKVINELDEVTMGGSQKGKNRAIKILEEKEWLNAYPGQSTEKNWFNFIFF